MKHKKDRCASTGCSPRRAAGYSLIEMAIAIVIIGLLFAPAADVYSTYTEYKKRDTTKTNVASVISAIQSYRRANGVFPCPSGLSVLRTDPAYGKAFDCTSTGPLSVAPAVGACDLTKGICIEKTKRASLLATGTPFQQRVVVGAVPFRQMQVPENSTYDGYGNRLVYVLTQSMGDITTLSTLNGAISIEDPTGKALVNPADSAIFAILSPGKDGVGGWSFEGGAVHVPCTGAIGADVANCNPGFEGQAPTMDAVIVDSYNAGAVGAAHYDDYVGYFQSLPDPLWRYISGTNNIQDLTDQSVGIGVNPASSSIQLDIASATTAPDVWDNLTGANATNTDALLVYGVGGNGNAGKMQVDSVCDATGTNCFDPIHLGGTTPGLNYQPGDPGMGCPSGQVMAGIDGTKSATTGGADCYALAMTCSPDPVTNETRYVTGVVNGVPTCEKLLIPCPAANQPAPAPGADGTTCPTISLSAAADGSSTYLAAPTWDPNGCRAVTYTCSKGNWSKTGDNGGICQLAASTNPPCDCTVQFNSNYTGTCVLTTSQNCSGGYTTTMTVNSCTCKANTQETQNCPSPWTGGTMKRTTTYSGQNCNGSVGNWNTQGCTCSLPNTTTTNVACPSGYNSGSGVMTGTLNKQTCTYSYTTNNSGCTCVSPSPNTRTIAVSCPPPSAGAGTQNQTFNATPGVCAWQNTGNVMGCTCPANTTESQACPSPWASGNQTRTMTYGSAPACNITYGAWDTSGCACTTNYTETEACPAPANGNRTRTHSFGAGPTCTETISAWNESACTCPANSTQSQACPAPYTGGSQTRSITYGAPPTCTQTIGNWDSSACQCSLPATKTQIVGCPAGYNSGSITQTATLNNATCSYGGWVDTNNTCACVTPSPATQTIGCGSCASPWSGTQSCDQTFVNNPGTYCDWGAPGAPYGCVCDTTPQAYSQPHDCSGLGLDCYYSNPADPDTGTVANVAGPGTCTAGTPNITHTGSCSSLGFTLQMEWTDGTTVASKPGTARFFPTGGCTCTEHRNWINSAQTVVCYNSSVSDLQIYHCSCK